MNQVNHIFILCAYKENPYLEECLKSLLGQTVKSRIIISTSTPNTYIQNLADKYEIPVYGNKDVKTNLGGENFNFGYSIAEANYVTLVHQDDVYERNYLESILEKMDEDTIIAFTDYYEIREGQKVYRNRLLKIKRMMNQGFRWFPKSQFIRNRIISFGNSICCPSVTYGKKNCPDTLFDLKFQCCGDWDVYSRLARRKGKFVYINEPLVGHRIHKGSDTTATIENGVRFKEEQVIFERYWPEFLAKRLAKSYKKAAFSNQ